MARSVSVRELKSKTSEILRDVRRGEEITVTSRGQAVARLVPERRKPTNADVEAWLKRLDDTAREVGKVWPKGVSAVEAIAEDRGRLERR
jgi:prevent-host-death family protein